MKLKIKQLIKKLQKCDPEAYPVILNTDHEDEGFVEHVIRGGIDNESLQEGDVYLSPYKGKFPRH